MNGDTGMKRYEVRRNSGWNWNVRSPWVVVDVFSGCVKGIEAYYPRKSDAEALIRELDKAA